MLTWLMEPFTYSFMQRGLMAGLLVSLACAALSAFVVWRGMAFLGDALAHVILPGIVAAYMAGINLLLGALGAALLAAFGIGWVTRGGRVREDTAIGVLFSGFFGLGVLMLSRAQAQQDLSHILFGDILGVSRMDLWVLAAVALVVIGVVTGLYKELMATSFDPGHAQAIGLSPDLVRHILLALMALAVVAAIQAVGVVLVIALLVTPAATASLLAKRMQVIIGLGTAISMGAAIVGLYASYYLNVASGAAIVLALTAAFGIAFVVGRVRG